MQAWNARVLVYQRNTGRERGCGSPWQAWSKNEIKKICFPGSSIEPEKENSKRRWCQWPQPFRLPTRKNTRQENRLIWWKKTEIWDKQQEQPWNKSFQIFEIVERVGVLSAFMCHGVCGHGFGCACGCSRGCEGGCGRVKVRVKEKKKKIFKIVSKWQDF